MGNLLSLRTDKGQFNSDIFVDFESAFIAGALAGSTPHTGTDADDLDARGAMASPDAKPKPNETELYNYLAAVLSQSKTIIEKLRNYQSVGGVIAKAISKPSMQTENDAWNAVLPQVGILKVFYEYATAVGEQTAARAAPPAGPCAALAGRKAVCARGD